MDEQGGESNATLEDTLAVFEDVVETGMPLTADEVADELDCPNRSAERNLTELASRGELETKCVGDHRIWWRPTDPEDSTNPDDPAVSGPDEHGIGPDTEIYERITDAFYALDDEWRFTHLNERAEEILGRSEDDLLGESIWDEFPEAAEGIIGEKFREAMATQQPVDFDLYYDPLGLWAEINAYPSETGLSVYFVDISERVETEQELSRYRRIIETVNDGVYAVDTDGRFTMVNEAYTEMLGYDREELVGEPVSKFVSDDIAETAQEIEAEQIAGEREAPTLEAELQTADGGTIVAEATFALLDIENGDHERIGVVRDVTDRREYERRIEEQRERYRRLVEAAPVAILTCDADGRIVFANEAAAQQVEFDERLVGKSALELVHDDDRAVAAERLETVLDGREALAPTEHKLVTPDGEIRHVITTAVPITSDGEPAAQVVMTDITERKRYEERLSETVAELEQSNERLDSFADMLAHELRNPLNVAQVYLSQIETDDETAVEQVASALDRIEEMINVLLVLAKGRAAVGAEKEVALAEVADTAWRTLETGTANLVVDTDRVVLADENYLQHLFENLFRNAIEHGEDDVTVLVGDLESVSASEASGDSTDESVGGFYVEDDGPGIPAEDREAVFQAGYSTGDNGLGLGLTFVSQLSDAYGWDCRVTESEAGGARFEFTNVSVVGDKYVEAVEIDDCVEDDGV
ncbi:PAS domain S-box protein [Halorussus lipolyticus]|uniref:PAS domain S-box protein n=1 Tax=Halorussus lipolyticus TaxID=3034024 RepID=UPI0023E8FC15|nr:PAS domain S-box protein [Halorussus sp. DT80]